MQKNKLSVRLFGFPIGILEQNQKGKLHFSYVESAHQPISLSLPLKEKSFNHAHSLSFFAGLLPEGNKKLSTLAKILGTDPHNAFDLLAMMGYDCPGAISFHALKDPIQVFDHVPIKGEVLSEKELEKRLTELRSNPFFISNEECRITLSGSSEKVAVCLVDNNVAIPAKNHFSTHIIKPGVPSQEDMILNEYFCMRLAKRMGCHVVDVELRKANKLPYLLISRFDREIQNQSIKLYHQEDFCQALGVQPSDKFQKNAGPGFKSCFMLLQKTNIPGLERNRFIQMIIFNILIGNMHAHAKNIAIRYITSKHIQLAPFYNISCTLIANSSHDMAMKVAGCYDRSQLNSHHWKFLCRKRGYSFPAFKTLFQEQSERIVDAAYAERSLMKEQNFNIDVVNKIVKILQKRRAWD